MDKRNMFGAACTRVEFEYLLYGATEPSDYDAAYWADVRRLRRAALAQFMRRANASLAVLRADYAALPVRMWPAAARDHDRRVYGE